MNKFEQVSSLDHQLSLAVRVGLGVGDSCTMKSHVGGSLYGEVQCVMCNGHMGPPVNRQTHTTENITFPQFRWRTVKMFEIIVAIQ